MNLEQNIKQNMHDFDPEINLNNGTQLTKGDDLSSKVFKLIDNEKCLFKEGDAFDDKLSEEHEKFPDPDFLKKYDHLLVYYDTITEDQGKSFIRLRLFGDVKKVSAFIEKIKNEFSIKRLSQNVNYGSTDDSEKGYIEISTIFIELENKEN